MNAARFARFARCLAALVLFLGDIGSSKSSVQVAAQETRIVSPNVFADAEAPDGVIPGGSARVQILYESADFSTLTQPHWITKFAWRPDASLNSPTHVTADSVEFRMSTTVRGVDNMSMTYDHNIGADAIVVFAVDGLTLPTQNTGPPSGPKDFDIMIVLDTPFLYDPSAGSLLLDFDLSGAGSLPADWIQNPWQSPTTKHIAGSLNGTTAGNTYGGIVTEFTFTALGDVDQNGSLDATDIDLLCKQITIGGSGFPFDLDNNGELNEIDRKVWVEELKHTFFGDANLDGHVDATDLNALALNWQTAAADSWTQGDFNGDGNVNATDLNELALNWRASSVAAAASQTVPEPAGFGLMLLATGMGWLVFHRRRANCR